MKIHAVETPESVAPFEARMANIYGDAFSGPPYSQGTKGKRAFARRFPGHARNEGFRCLVAEDDGEILGFAYGFTNRPGQWWHGQIAPAMEEAGLSAWLEDAFALTELAVASGARGRGVGAMLHDGILENLPHRRALLSTHRERTVARDMYDRRGWNVLLDDFVYPASGEPAVIMGRSLRS